MSGFFVGRAPASARVDGNWRLVPVNPLRSSFRPRDRPRAAAWPPLGGQVQTECINYARADSDTMRFGAESRSESDTTERWRSYACSLARRVLTDAIHR